MSSDVGKWKFHHTMLRVKDPQKSLEYYKFLGLSQINKLSYPDNKFDLYFLGPYRSLSTSILSTDTTLHSLRQAPSGHRRSTLDRP